LIFATTESRSESSMPIIFSCDSIPLQSLFDRALDGLSRNLHRLSHYPSPVLIEGAEYQGVWLECAPHEGLVYSVVDSQIGFANNDIFLQHQNSEGYLPCFLRKGETGSAHVQTVVPFAATALEWWSLYGQPAAGDFLRRAYEGASRYDQWLRTYRNTRNTGLCEVFCEYDTGHDRSPRWKGIPRECPGKDARICPDVSSLPFLAPDLSATVYGGRLALAQMARALNLPDAEARRWEEAAEEIRLALMKHCFDEEDGCFYDRDAQGNFIRIRSEVLGCVLREHAVPQPLFEQIYERHIKNPEAFWTPYPLPSVAADDPQFVHPIPANSWGGASQALTALRAPRWFDHYGKHEDLVHLMKQWIHAMIRDGSFRQQLDPWTGEFTQQGADRYSPAMLCAVDFVSRLHGVRRLPDAIEWNCRLPDGATESRYHLDDNAIHAALELSRHQAVLKLDNRIVATHSGQGRVVTDLRGRPLNSVLQN
jgi:hypothetical protein